MKRFWPYICGAVFLLIAGLILFPLFSRWPNGHRHGKQSCMSNLKQISLGIFMYAQDYDDKLPPAIFPGKTVGWAEGLQPYLKSAQIFQCPTEWHSETPLPNQPGFTDYWLNSNIAGLESKKINYPEQIIMLGDGGGNSPESTASYAINQLPVTWRQSSNSPAKRHLDGANYTFADGHVKWAKPEEITQAHPSKKNKSYTFRIK